MQNLTFADGNSTGEKTEGGGGGAIFVRGGRVKVVNSRFVRNRCDRTGPDLGGAAIRVLSQSKNLPVYVVSSTFGGPRPGRSCSNGGALSSIGVSWVVLNSVCQHNPAIGSGANPARAGTPGGGSGGAIYSDGNLFTLRIAGTVIENNHASEGGGAVFFVSNDRTGTMTIENSTLRHNPSAGFETRGYPGHLLPRCAESYCAQLDPHLIGRVWTLTSDGYHLATETTHTPEPLLEVLVRSGSSIAGVLLVIWLIIGAVAAGQRGYFKSADTNCAKTGTILVTIVAGPLNYIGVNPKINCSVPQPSK